MFSQFICSTSLLISLLLVGCGQDGTDGRTGLKGKDGKPGAKGPNGQDGQNGKDGEPKVILIAGKTYSPSTWFDDSVTLDSEISFSLPRLIPIITGNSGNHTVTLTVDNLTCIYKGGADTSKPLKSSNQTQIAKGGAYYFQQCSDGEPLETARKGTVFTLSVNNGDSTAPTWVQYISN